VSSVLAKTLRDQRRALLGWGVGVLALVAYVVAFWPSVEGSDALQQMTAELPEALRAFLGESDLGTARGFFSAQLYALMLPVMVAILGIGKGAGTTAGEEERGELALLLVQPLPRWRVAVEKAVAVLLVVAAVVVLSGVVLGVGIAVVGADVAAGDIVGATAGLLLLGWVAAGAALGLGAGTGRRGVAVAGASVLLVLSYLADAFAGFADGLGWLRAASPWRWAFRGDALAAGPSWVGALGLLALAAGLLAAGIWRFEHRDVRG
jgi:ABC-2 type transport system permease protein